MPRLMDKIERCRDYHCPDRKQCERYLQNESGRLSDKKTFRSIEHNICTKMIKHLKLKDRRR